MGKILVYAGDYSTPGEYEGWYDSHFEWYLEPGWTLWIGIARGLRSKIAMERPGVISKPGYRRLLVYEEMIDSYAMIWDPSLYLWRWTDQGLLPVRVSDLEAERYFRRKHRWFLPLSRIGRVRVGHPNVVDRFTFDQVPIFPRSLRERFVHRYFDRTMIDRIPRDGR